MFLIAKENITKQKHLDNRIPLDQIKIVFGIKTFNFIS